MDKDEGTNYQHGKHMYQPTYIIYREIALLLFFLIVGNVFDSQVTDATDPFVPWHFLTL